MASFHAVIEGETVINPALYGDLFSREAMGSHLPPSQRDLEVSRLARPVIAEDDLLEERSDLELDLRDFVQVDLRREIRENESDRDSGFQGSRPNSRELASPEIFPVIPAEDQPESTAVALRPRPSSAVRPSSTDLHKAAHVAHEAFEQFLSLQGAIKGSQDVAAEIFEAVSRTAQGLGDAKMGTEIVFPGLEGILSLPTLLKSGKNAAVALKEGRMVDFSDHSSGALKASLAISGAGVELASAAKEIMKEGWIEAAKAAAKPAGSVASTLALAASGVSMAGWAVYGGMQVFALSQMSKPMNNLQRILKSSMPEELKMHEAFREMEKEFVVTKEEIEAIRAEYTDEKEALKQIEVLTKKKFNKLERCVGDEKAKLISSQMMVISRTLDHARANEDEAHLIPINQMISQVVKSIKNEMAKQKVLRYEKLAVSVAGLVAAGVGIACPIAGAVMAVAISAAAIYIWYQGRKDNAEKYVDMSVFGRKLFDFEPDESLVDEGVEETAPISELAAEDEIDDYLPPGAMLINPAAVRGFDINEVDVSLPEDGILINAAALGIKPNTSHSRSGFLDYMKHTGDTPPSDWMA